MKFKQLMKKRGQRGLTLIEASMVLALSAVVVAGVMMYYQSATDNNKLQAAVGELGGIQTAVQTIYGGQSTYAGLDSAAIGTSPSIPNNYKRTNGTFVTPWGGYVTVGVTATDSKKYNIQYTGLSQGACMSMVGQNLGNSFVGLGNSLTAVGTMTPASAMAAGAAGQGLRIKFMD